MKSQAAIFAEYAALRTTCALVNALPYAVATWLARTLASVLVRVFRFQRRRTLGRLRSVFPERAEGELVGLAAESLANVFATGVEMMRAPQLDRRWMDARVRDGILYKDRLQAVVDEGRGAVIMVPHTGNWYMAAWSMAKYGLPLCALAARQRNPKLDAWMKRQYGDIEVFDRDCRDSLRRIRDALAAGRAFAILPDLRVRKRDVAAPFLGGTANVSRAGAMFAVKARAPIVVAAMRREAGRHVFEHLATLRPFGGGENAHTPVEERDEAQRLTVEAMKLLDGFVRQHPGQWFWYNKRWILEPPEN